MPNPAIDPARKAEMLRLADIARAADEAPCCPDIARALRLEESTVRKYLKRAGKLGRPEWEPGRAGVSPIGECPAAHPKSEPVAVEGEGLPPIEVGGEGPNVHYRAASLTRITTLEELLAHLKVDPAKWSVKRWKCVAGQVAMKINRGEDARGRKQRDGTTVKQVFWVTAEFEPVKADPHAAWIAAAETMYERAAARAPYYPVRFTEDETDSFLYLIAMEDVHYGKYSWGKEVGRDFDVAIADAYFRDSLEQLLAAVRPRKLGRILLTVGSDLVHYDTIKGMTTGGTQLDFDSRYQHVIETVEDALFWAVEDLARVAPVTCVWKPGNHDFHASYHLTRAIKARFHNHPHVEVDVSPGPQKYYRWGKCLIGFDHSDKIKPQALPGIMARDRPRDWAEITCKEWIIGHKHMTEKWVDCFNDVVVRRVRSLSEADRYHAENGWRSDDQAAESFLYHRETGFAGNFVARPRRERLAG